MLTKAILKLAVVAFGLTGVLAESTLPATHKPKNIILMVGDGMGPSHMTAYRLFKDNPKTKQVENTYFDQFLIGSLSTDPDEAFGTVTDSAASATAYAIGKKTFNGAIGMDKQKQHHTTALQWAKKAGKSAGLVATSQVVHATPASFAAHVESRRDYDKIADQFYDNQYQSQPYVDVILGGGTKYFARKDRDLVKRFQEKGYQYVTSKKDLAAAKSNRMLGLFAEKGLPIVHEREDDDPTLAEMTSAAIKALSANEQGFFLVIEGSQIDWESHANNIHGTLYEMQEFEQALQVVHQFSHNRNDTLVLLTADHETGGLSIGRKVGDESQYVWKPQMLHTMQMSLKQAMVAMAKVEPANRGDWASENMGLNLTAEQKRKLEKLELNEENYFWLNELINQQTHTGWTTGGHTGVDVNLYGFGKGVESFRGHHSNHVIGQKLIELVKPVEISQ